MADQLKRNFLGSVFWVICFYIFIFQPPVVDKIFYLIIQLFAVVLLGLIFFRKLYRFFIIFRFELLFVLIVVVYTLYRDLLGGGIVYSDRFVGWFFQAFIVSGVLVAFCYSSYIKRIDVSQFGVEIYLAVLAAALITIILYFSPSLDSFYGSIQLDDYYDRYSGFDHRYRAYGVSENLTFTYSVVLGICAGYSMLLSKKSWVFLLLIPFFIFGVSVNARIGFFPVVFFLFYISFLGSVKSKAIIFAVCSIIMLWLFISPPDFIEQNLWRFGFFLEAFDFLINGLEGDNIIARLINNHVTLPVDLFDVVFGSGVSLYDLTGERHSDIGYIIQLNYGGFLLLFFLILVVLFMSWRLFKVLGFRHWYSWLFPILIIVLNFKGFIFAMTPGGRFLVLVYMFFIFRNSVTWRFPLEIKSDHRYFKSNFICR